jgi:hypothetical protein
MLRLVSLTVAALAATPLVAQPPATPLPKPDAEFAEPFSAPVGVRELRDGRVVVADLRDKTVQVVDFRRNAAAKVGREGSGPNEYGMPMRLVPLPADSAAVFDPVNARYFVIKGDGTAGGTFSIAAGDPAPGPAGPGGGRVMGIMAPQGADARGRLYFRAPPVIMTEQGPRTADSSAILRYDRATKKTDTLGWAWNGQTASVSGSRTEMRVMVGQRPFAVGDEWTVLPDGRVAVVRAREYRVDILGGGAPVRGAVQPYAPIAVTEADKAEWREARRRSAPVLITREEGPRGNRTQAGAPPQVSVPEPSEWPATKPAFVGGSVTTSPDGHIWVQRSRKAGDQVPVYDVFDATGRLVRRVALAAETRLLGFGAGTVYTTRRDEDDLQYLQRHRLP